MEHEYDATILVDTVIMPEYRDCVGQRLFKLYPDLEKTAPVTFDVSKLERWLHPRQVDGRVTGFEIHEYLKNRNLLGGCLGFAGLLAIQKRGGAFFRKHFAGKAPFAWRSVAEDHSGRLISVPYLVEDGDIENESIENEGIVVVNWLWLGFELDSDDPALRFAN